MGDGAQTERGLCKAGLGMGPDDQREVSRVPREKLQASPTRAGAQFGEEVGKQAPPVGEGD